MTTNIEPRVSSMGIAGLFGSMRGMINDSPSMLRELAAGIVVAALTLPLCVAAGVLAFAPLGPEFAASGAFAGVYCAAIGGIAAACVRRSSFVTTIPTTPIAVIQASFVASALADAAGDRTLVLLAIPVCVFSAGLWQLLFAASGFSRVVKFVPHPVVAGFGTGVGLLIALHQVPLFLNIRSYSEIGQMTWSQLAERIPVLAFGGGILVSILILKRTAPRIPNLLVALFLGTLTFYFVRSIAPQIDLGRTIGNFSLENINLRPSMSINVWEHFFTHVALLKVVLVSSLTLAIVGTLDTFFSLRTAQNLADIRFNPRRELSGQGIGNMVSAISGGLVVSTSLSLTTANHEAGGRTRISTITSAAVLLIGALLLPKVILSLPLIVLASILVAASFRLIDRECIETVRTAFTAKTKEGRFKAQRDAITIFSVLLATIIGEPIAGVAMGFGLSCLIFLVDMSRPVVAGVTNGSTTRSKRIRSAKEKEILLQYGTTIKVFDLQGVLFFGNGYNLAEHIRATQADAEIVILNCRRVTNVDTSGWKIFGEIAARLRKQGKSLLICDHGAKWADDFMRIRTRHTDWQFFSSLDGALEWAEREILNARLSEDLLTNVPFEQTDLGREIPRAELSALLAYMPIEHYEKGAPLCRKGDPSDRFWILTSGTVSVRLQDSRMTIRLASLGPGCTVGEMGLLKGLPRSADVCADDAVTAYVLTAENFAAIQRDNSKLGQCLLMGIARQLTERLVETTEELRVANR